MQSKSDAQLLREYAEQGVEPAFTEIVARYTNLVYSVAARHTESPDMAAEVTQRAFIGLARVARTLAPKLAAEASLAGWLYRSARNAALNLRRDQLRQHSRERHVMQQLDPTSDAAPDWWRLRPVLDDAMSELGESDHDALVMRFFNNQDLRAVGRALGMSDDAAQKRVSRALDKLRQRLLRRGIHSTAAALSVVLSANALQNAPAGLSATISGVLTIVGGKDCVPALVAAKAITMTTLQKSLIGLAAAAALGVGTYEVRHNSYLRNQMETLRQQTAPMAGQVLALQRERDAAAEQLAALRHENERLRSNLVELPKLRSEIERLRAQNPANNPHYVELTEMQERVKKLRDILAQRPQARIPEFRFLGDNDYWEAVQHRPLDSEEDYLAALSNLRSRAEFSFVTGFLNPALTAYMQANNGQFPSDLTQLQPYFPSPIEDAILERWEIGPASLVPQADYGNPIITMKAAVDEDWDPRYVVGPTKFGSAGVDVSGQNGWGVISPTAILQPAISAALAAYQAQNDGAQPTDPSQLQPYLNLLTPEQQAAYQKLMNWRQPR
jgi:RNA polymerase sigma factor (sigma-70 family)